MKKIIIICGTVLGAVLLGTVIFLLCGKGGGEQPARAVSASEINVTDGDVSRGDFLSMCMYLYEQLSGNIVEPRETNGENPSVSVKKAYALGLITENDSAVYSDSGAVTREEAAVLLYTAMLRYRPDAMLETYEINNVLNECYDNMNITYRDACAFIIRSGAAKTGASFYPSELIRSDEAADWVNALYSLYKSDHEVTFKNGKTVKCGYTEKQLLSVMGEPSRRDRSFYGGENLIYSGDDIYAVFYVDKGVVRGFFCNLGVESGTDVFEEVSGAKDKGAYYRADNVRTERSTEVLRETEQREFFEMIQAYRRKNGMGVLVEDKTLMQMGVENSKSVSDGGIDMAIPGKRAVVRGGCAEDMYIQLVTSHKYDGALDAGGRRRVCAGAGLWYGSIEPCATVIIDETMNEDNAEPVPMPPEQKKDAECAYSGETPSLASPLQEDTAALGTPIVIRLAERTAESFIARVSSSETGENIVYARIYGDSLVVSPSVLEDGTDYMVTVSVDSDGEERFSEISAVRYGTPEPPQIVSPLMREFVDTTGINVSWKSKYSDFTVTLYNENNEVLGSQRIIGDTTVSIDGLADGKYSVEVAAQRKDTNAVMASSVSEFFVQSSNLDITYTEKPKVKFGESRYSSVFGGTLVYSSKAQADADMRTVTVPVWKINDRGEKYASKMSVTVNKAVAAQVQEIFAEIFGGSEKFPIKSLGGYNWRSTATGSRSQHSYGTCIDINPDENYCIYNSGTRIGSFWKPYENPYSITPDGDVMRAFKSRGWTWGGEWNSLKDYMHFSYLGG